jgi:hypothetical protein
LLVLYPFVMLDEVAARSSVYTCSLKRLDHSEGRKDCEIDRPGTTLRLYSSVSVCNFCMYTPFRAIQYRILGARLFNTFWKISLSTSLLKKVCNLLSLYWIIFGIHGLYTGRRQRLTPAMLHTVNTFCVMYVAN